MANTKITTDVIEDDAITTSKIANDAITTSKIANDAITNDKITANSVNAEQLNVSGNGTAGQFLSSDGDGTMSWTTPSATSAQSLTQNGYATLNGGLIIQWGYYGAASGGTIAITFPIQFPNACLNVSATPEALTDSGGIDYSVGLSTTPTTTSVTFTKQSSRAFYWQAIGY